MLRLAFIYSPEKPHAEVYGRAWAETVVALGAPRPPVISLTDDVAVQALLPETDLLIALGGDGSLIRMARLGAAHKVPALGVRFGRVGFLSAIKPADVPGKLKSILEGGFWVEERAMLRAEHLRAGRILREVEALNDVVVSRGRTPRVIHLETLVDGALLDEFICDGAIVATATGSTAYSLASGGPILAPTQKSHILTLISPYLSPIRSLVLPHTACVTFRVHAFSPASLTADGTDDHELEDGDEVQVQGSDKVALFARVTSRTYFYETIKQRLRRQDD